MSRTGSRAIETPLPGPPRAGRLDATRVVLAAITSAFVSLLSGLVGRRRNPKWARALELTIAATRGSWSVMPAIGMVRWRDVGEALSPLKTDGLPPRSLDLRPDGPPLYACWLEPPARGEAVLLYLHGGGYVFGSIRTHGSLIGALARASRARTLAVEYRLAPEHPAPAAVEDAVAAYRYLLAEGVAAERIVVAGDSAGGGLALLLLLALRARALPLPAGAVPISPWVDLACSGESFSTNADYDFVGIEHCRLAARAFADREDLSSPELSPLFADLDGLPPLLIHAGGRETLVDQIRSFVARAREASVDVTYSEYPEMVHVWHLHRGLTPEADEAIAAIGRFIELRTTPRPS